MQNKEEVIVPEGECAVVLDETQTELELIKKKTRAQLELLRKQTERLKLFDTNIDVDFLIKWYELKSSQFSQLACAYGHKNWYDRQVLHAEVITGAIVLGLTIHALAFSW